jgi:coenzyme F420-reducing hydrogenase delta subunit
MTFQEYRNKWFYLDPIQTERINSRIAYIENTLTKVVVQKYSINFNYYVYSDLSKIIQSLQEIITVLQECSYDDKTYTEVYRLTFLKDLLNQITEEISIK